MGRRADNNTRQRLRMAYIISVASIAMVLFVLGLIGLVMISSGEISDYVKENLKLQIGLSMNATDEDAEDLRAQLQLQPYVKEAHLITPDDALEEFKSTWDEDPIEVLGFNPLGYTIELSLQAEYATLDSIRHIEAVIMQDYGDHIRGISKDENLIHEVNTNARKIQLILMAVCFVLSLIMIALINNTIRLAIYAKRFTIKTMQLVGATAHFIRRPFLISGFVQGLIAGILAIIALWIMIFFVSNRFLSGVTFTEPGMIGLLMGGIILAGLFISFISTYFAVHKFLNVRVEELY
ncbi:MAG: permease-like cell division protein FtsX [Flavobacteriales bacterium]|nr:permease-like cell division protein FtsX [Flavobacteriales bacterium]